MANAFLFLYFCTAFTSKSSIWGIYPGIYPKWYQRIQKVNIIQGVKVFVVVVVVYIWQADWKSVSHGATFFVVCCIFKMFAFIIFRWE